MLGLKPVNLVEALALPMYDAFSSKPKNSAPYGAIQPGIDMTGQNAAKTPAAALSARLPVNSPDQISQRTMDRILWKFVHAQHASPPPPGPNASASDTEPGYHVLLPRIRRGQGHSLASLHRAYRRHSRNR